MLGHVADHDRGSSCEELADRLATTVRERYSWPAEHYLYDSLRSGNPVARVRPNALRAVSAGLVDAASAVAIVDRAAQDDLTTPWGVRSLSSRDPTYDPHAYHEGQVWTIATAWAADAAFAVGQPERAVEYLRTISARYASEGGYGHECYRGDRGEPYNSCFLLGFSVAPFLAVLFERLWGIRIGPGESDLRVVPAFPRGWSSARLRGLRLSGGKLDLEWAPGGLSVRWSGPGTLSVDTGAGIHAVPPGAPTRLAVPSPPEL